jgi:hypothetical protein
MDCDLWGSIDRCGNRRSQPIPDDAMRSIGDRHRAIAQSLDDIVR